MSNTYQMVCGWHPTARVVISAMGWSKATVESFHRLRDFYINPGDGDPHAVVLTRTGTGAWTDEADKANAEIADMPGFVMAHTDSFDETFMHHHFEIPEGQREEVKRMIKEVEDAGDAAEIFEKPMDRFRRIVEGMRP